MEERPLQTLKPGRLQDVRPLLCYLINSHPYRRLSCDHISGWKMKKMVFTRYSGYKRHPLLNLINKCPSVTVRRRRPEEPRSVSFQIKRMKRRLGFPWRPDPFRKKTIWISLRRHPACIHRLLLLLLHKTRNFKRKEKQPHTKSW